MVSATKIGSAVPSHLIDAVTERLPDHLPDLPSLPLRPRPRRRRRVRLAVPLAVLGIGAAVFFVVRSRRTSTRVGTDAPVDIYAPI